MTRATSAILATTKLLNVDLFVQLGANDRCCHRGKRVVAAGNRSVSGFLFRGGQLGQIGSVGSVGRRDHCIRFCFWMVGIGKTGRLLKMDLHEIKTANRGSNLGLGAWFGSCYAGILLSG